MELGKYDITTKNIINKYNNLEVDEEEIFIDMYIAS